MPRFGGHPRKPENNTESLSLFSFSVSSSSSSFVFLCLFLFVCMCEGVGRGMCQNRSVEMGKRLSGVGSASAVEIRSLLFLLLNSAL